MAIILDKDKLVGLHKLDNWLAKQPWDKNLELPTILQVRELITKIQSRGYYNESEQIILNQIREEYSSKYRTK